LRPRAALTEPIAPREMSVKSICGVILISPNPGALASFYAEALGIVFKYEEHGDFAPHWGVDVGSVHFGVHPPENFRTTYAGHGSVALAFHMRSLAECQARLNQLQAECIAPAHDEGFGMVALFRDPEGNLFEIVELTYAFPTDCA
jgi:predicted enzyme related to lactoylglutathione lyase